MTEYLGPQTQVDFSRLETNEADLLSRRTSIVHRDLAPYVDDDTFLIQRIGARSRLLRHTPELRPQIQDAFLADDDESIVQLVDDLEMARQSHSLDNERPVHTILSFMNLLEDVNELRVKVDADEHTQGRINALISLLCQKIAYSFPEEKLDDAQLSAEFLWGRTQKIYEKFYTKITGRTYQEGEPVPEKLLSLSNLRTRLGMLTGALTAYHESYKYIDGLPSDSGESISLQQVEADTQHISALFASIRAGQRYGVKMGYIAEEHLGGALIFSPPISAEAFNTPEETHSVHHPLMDKTDSVAIIIHTQRKHHKRVKSERNELHGLSGVGFNDLGPSSALFLGANGELYTWSDGKVSLRDIALQKGKYEAYRDLQATVLAHYFDLTHKLDGVAHITKTLREQPVQVNPGTRKALESIERLVVPRVEYVKEAASSSAGMVAEEDQPVRLLRRHDVVWHVRRLPEGWHPSPAALKLAEKLGVVLGKNETIVKDHERGTLELGQITAHQFVERPDVES